MMDSRTFLHQKLIRVHGVPAYLRAQLKHNYLNTFNYRNADRRLVCDLCNRPRESRRHLL